ncbi:SGNH/GDSL hydrolase family protein [Streptomyces sp. VRA16 Mangrove soil]|uniref:SGNH/GDSL hydrolase family protein n=1 Tax=Streptomyces sp. VRA16 Mangrove soil TaxID=2817434 RepID=UPI001A9CDE42|nr:SGNH/GDSL hydrolase family protein [Streptomyces sp. VRA16 Mangrove soil]MBO1329853.1 SGNH/GDSL hydrolase family protein [Streptomyces sp. VRA16 Mangrove soil]
MRRLLPVSRAGRALTAGVALFATGAAFAPVGAAAASPAPKSPNRQARDYVALGDSYASAPLVPTQVDAVCARSDQNYPSLVARSRSARLTDVTCSGATTEDMTASQTDGVAPQLDALDRGTDLVTLTIGGNDIGFSTVLGTCARLTSGDPAGAPCRTHFTDTGTDRITEAIGLTGSKVAGVLRGIRQRAPHARVAVVGYPDLFPDDGVGCTSSSVPLAAGDFPWLRDKEKELNAMLAREARHAGATYVNTYAPTVGHDLCRPAGERWIETFAPQTPAAPLHPNAMGESAMAGAVETALTRHCPHR